jgi:uncharacterized membrane protein
MMAEVVEAVEPAGREERAEERAVVVHRVTVAEAQGEAAWVTVVARIVSVAMGPVVVRVVAVAIALVAAIVSLGWGREGKSDG